MKTILLTTGRIPASLELARSLGKAGHRVLVADSLPIHICKYSNSVAQSFKIASATTAFDQYRKDVLKIIHDHKVDLVLPVSEETLFLSKLIDDLPDHCEIFTLNHELMKKLHNKFEFTMLAQSFGLRTPKTKLMTERVVEPSFLDAGYVIKAVYTRSGQDVYIQDPGADIPKDVDMEKRQYILQERIYGEHVCTFSVVQQGKLVSTVMYRPKMTLGTVSICFEKIENPEAMKWIETFVEKSGYHGFVSFDFIVGEDKQVFALECNPRITSGIHLMNASTLEKSITNKAPIVEEPKFLGRQAMVGLGMLTRIPDMMSSPKKFRTLMGELLLSKDVIFDIKDPLPVVHQFACYAQFMAVCREHKISLKDAMFYDLEFRQEHLS